MNNIAKINNELSVGIFINPALQDDYKDNTKTIVNIAPFSFDYGNIYSDYYIKPLYSSYIALYIEYDREIFELYGYSEEEAKESVRKISKFYTEIANSSKAMEELAEVQSYYNIVEDKELKEMFEAYANIWASRSTEEYTKLLLIMDTHSPDKVRVNAVLSSIDEFYRVYNIKEDDEMYKRKKKELEFGKIL